MPQPITADYFQQTAGVDATTATELARQHNAAAGLRTEDTTAPLTSSAPAPRQAPPLSPRYETKVAARAAEYAKFPGVSAEQARSLAEQEFAIEHGSGPDRSVMLHQLAAGQTEEAIVQSIDESMEPARAAYEYTMPQHDGSPENVEMDRHLREVMFGAGLPREMGNALARQLDETARHLFDASEEQIDTYCAENEATLRRMWGGQFQQRYDTMRQFLLAQGERSPMLKELISNHPELFAHWSVADALARVAESQQRAARRAR